MNDQADIESLRVACDALQIAIERRAGADPKAMHAPLRALTGLQQAALNAPQNRGWLRKRKTELRDTLNVLSGADDLRLLYKNIEAILHRESPRPEFIGKKRWFPGRQF